MFVEPCEVKVYFLAPKMRLNDLKCNFVKDKSVLKNVRICAKKIISADLHWQETVPTMHRDGQEIKNAIKKYQRYIYQFCCGGNVLVELQKVTHRTPGFCKTQFEYHCFSMRQKWKGPCCV